MNEEETSPLTARLLDEQDSTKEEAVNENSEKKDDTEVTALSSLSIPTGETPWERGEKQPSKFRDWPFGALFHIQFVAVVTLGSIYTNNFLQLQKQSNQDDLPTNTINLGFIIPALVSAGTSLLLILVALIVLTRMGKTFITCSVWTSAIISFMIGITALSANLVPLGVLSLISALIGCCYAYAVRNRIPFAAANLNAGVSSIKSNGGITCVVLLIGLMLFGWMMLWAVSLIGVMDVQQVCNQQGDGNDDDCDVQVSHPGYLLLWVFFLFWTQQVFKNVIHATVAGLVGTWYFDPQDAKSFCSSALGTSLYRSVTYSFGSICFGSLCVAILQTLDYIVQSLRNQREREGDQNPGMALLLCCLDCILSIMAGIMEFFNKWAFIYVGVYGYDFLTAGKKSHDSVQRKRLDRCNQ